LDRDCALPLVPAARAGDPTRADLPLLRYVAPKLVNVLVVDLVDLVLAEVTGLAPGGRGARLAPAAGARPVALLRPRSLGCHASFLERDVVVRRGRAEVGVSLRGRACRHVLVLAAGLAAAAEEL